MPTRSSSAAIRSRRAAGRAAATASPAPPPDLGDAHARIQRRERILEDDLDVAPRIAQRFAVQREQVPAVDARAAFDHRLVAQQLQHALPIVVLPQPDSPTSASVRRRRSKTTRRRPR
jgi:hypothetical protein